MSFSFAGFDDVLDGISRADRNLTDRKSRSARDPYSRNVESYMFPHEFKPHSNLSVYDREDRYADMSSDAFRSSYRRQLCQSSKYNDADVSHIIATANGGINASENAYMSSKSFNRAIKDSADHINAALVGKDRACVAARVSRKYGTYDGPTGSELHRQGVRELAEDGILVRQGGGIDRRCAAVRSGDLILRNDGRVDGRSSYVRGGNHKFY